MIVGLYTSRIMLNALGVDNYGIQNVVGSIVSMTSVITGAMSSAISRFLTYGIGQGDKKRLKTIFSTSMNVQIILSVIAVFVLEIVGVWFLNFQANIPIDRMVAANWVLQCSIITTILTLVCSPFQATLIAHEHMTIYAYMSIVDVFLKLLVCYLIAIYEGDRLILLSVLYVGVYLFLQVSYSWYCGKHFYEAHYNWRVLDKKLLKEMTSFSGWNLFGNTAWMLNTQGVNMLINVFFGVAFNAARGIAVTVNAAIQSFITNFMVAFTPQITKNYAVGNFEYTYTLVNRGAKFSWLLMYMFIVPVVMEADMLLKLWLGNPPEYSAMFLRLAVFESLAVQSGSVLLQLIQADGHIRRYSVEVSFFGFMVFPITWIAFLCGFPVWFPYLIFIIIYFNLNIIRFINLKRLMNFSVRRFLREALLPCILVSITAFILPLCVSLSMSPGLPRFIIVVFLSILWTGLCAFFIGLTKNERMFFINRVKIVINKIKL